MGGRGRDSGLGARQITLENVINRNIIANIISASADRREMLSGSESGGGGAGATVLLKKCACCGEYTIPVNTEYETCLICGWIDDKFQNAHPDSMCGKNPLCLTAAKAAYKQ